MVYFCYKFGHFNMEVYGNRHTLKTSRGHLRYCSCCHFSLGWISQPRRVLLEMAGRSINGWSLFRTKGRDRKTQQMTQPRLNNRLQQDEVQVEWDGETQVRVMSGKTLETGKGKWNWCKTGVEGKAGWSIRTQEGNRARDTTKTQKTLKWHWNDWNMTKPVLTNHNWQPLS